MYDKTVRRRRAVLGLLVASSLILLTAYFGESAGGALHTVQRGILDGRLADPGGRQPGAQARARPLRLGRRHRLTPRATSRTLRNERDALRAAARPRRRGRSAENAQLARPARASTRRPTTWTHYRPVTARVIGQLADALVRDRSRSTRAPRRHRRRPARDRHRRRRRRRRGPDRQGRLGRRAARRSCALITDSAIAVAREHRRRQRRRGSSSPRPGNPSDLMHRTRRPERRRPPRASASSPPAPCRDATTCRPLYPPRPPDRPRHAVDDAGTRRPGGPRAPVRQPAPPRLRPGPDQAAWTPTADDADPPTARRSASSPSGVAVVVLQVAAVSQLPIFGANADLTPLVVAAVGLLCGSLTGAVFGFGVGLFFDTRARADARLSSSLVCVAVGYGAGRLRELRDPQAALVPLVVGARRDRGHDVRLRAHAVPARRRRAGELPAAAPDPRDARRSTRSSRCRSTRSCAAGCCPRLPEDPRRRRRRAYTTGGLSPLSRAMMPSTPPPTAARRSRRSSPCGSRSLGAVAFALFAIIFFRLWYLQVLSGDQYLAQARDNRVRDGAIAGAARRDRRPQRPRARRATARRGHRSSTPPPAARPSATLAAAWGQAWAKRRAALAARATRARAGHDPADPDRRAAPALHAPRPRAEHVAQTIHPSRGRGRSCSSRTPTSRSRPTCRRRCAPTSSERPEQLPGRDGRAGLPARLPAQDAGRADPRERRPDQPATQLKDQRYKGVKPGTAVGQDGLERTYDKYLRGDDGAYRDPVNAAGERRRAARRRASPCRASGCSCRCDLGLQQAGEKAISRSADPGNPGAFVAMDPRDGQLLRDGLLPELQPADPHQAAHRPAPTRR